MDKQISGEYLAFVVAAGAGPESTARLENPLLCKTAYAEARRESAAAYQTARSWLK